MQSLYCIHSIAITLLQSLYCNHSIATWQLQSFYCYHSIAMWPEVASTFEIVEYLREITAQKSPVSMVNADCFEHSLCMCSAYNCSACISFALHVFHYFVLRVVHSLCMTFIRSAYLSLALHVFHLLCISFICSPYLSFALRAVHLLCISFFLSSFFFFFAVGHYRIKRKCNLGREGGEFVGW